MTLYAKGMENMWVIRHPSGVPLFQTLRNSRKDAVAAGGCDTPKKWQYLRKLGYKAQKIQITWNTL